MAFALPPLGIGIRLALVDRLGGAPEQPALGAVLPFGQLEPLPSPLSGLGTALDAWHLLHFGSCHRDSLFRFSRGGQLFGATIMIRLRPSMRGTYSIVPESANCSTTVAIIARPSSWFAISRPRNITVTFVLLPSAKNPLI